MAANKTANKPAAKKRATKTKKKPDTPKPSEEKVKSESTKAMSVQTKALLLAAIAVIFFSLIFVKGANVWTALHNFVLGMFGNFAILWPMLLLYVALVSACTKKGTDPKLRGKVSLAVSVIIMLSTTVYEFMITALPTNNYFDSLFNIFIDGTNGKGAGVLSGIFGYPFAAMFGVDAARILLIVVLIVMLMMFFGISISHIYNFVKKPVSRVKDNVATVHREQMEKREKRRAKIESEKIAAENVKPIRRKRSRIDIPLDDEPVLIPQIEEQSEQKRVELEDIVRKFNSEELGSKPSDNDESDVASMVAAAVSKKKKTPVKSDPNQIQPDPESVPIEVELAEELKAQTQQKDDGYHFPPVELLRPSVNADDSNAMQELQDNGKKLIETLASFGVKASIVDISRGPSVTRFELQPAAGVKISKITNLADDIALNLAANGVRIEAPIPGKAALGIEIPNKIVSMVSMRELIDSKEFKRGKSKLTVVLGRDISGNIVVTDLCKMPHLLIAGTTGSGKSVCVNSILLSILYKASPDEVKLLLVDPKMVEFSKYKGIPHLLIPVVSDAKKAAGALNWAVSEMLERYKTFAAYNVRDIDGYNGMVADYKRFYAKDNEVKNDGDEDEEEHLTEDGLPIPTDPMCKIVIAIDELADLMMAAPNEVEESICRLAQMARAAGMHLVIATQRPSVNVITGVIKANIPSRIALQVSSQIDSRTILDFGGAEKLIGKGDMLFSHVGAPKPKRVQGCYASDEEIENVTGYIKKSHSSDYDEAIVEKIDLIAKEELNSDKKEKQGSTQSDDPMMDEAIKLVVEAGQASTSLLQRRLRLGYARAGRLIDEMEQMGIVGPHEGSKPRQVLMTHQEWLERNNILGD